MTPDYRKETTTVIGGDGNPSVTTSVYYDEYGNKIKTESGTDIETYTSDYAGNITSVKSARANAESWTQTHTAEYDFMGNVIKETDELGNITRTEYDQLGRATKVYDANGYATEFKYDNLGRVIEQKTPFEEKDGTVHYSKKQMWYDNNGNVIKERTYTNASGETESYNEVAYTYDNRNRLVMTQTNDGETSNYTQNYYDAVGNLLRVYTGLTAPLAINGLDDVETSTDTEYAVTKYSYDKFGQVLTVTDALGKVESNTYDTLNGILLSTTDRNGQTFNFSYDGMGNITEKALSDGTNTETTTYGLTGQVLTRQNGVTTISYTYNNKGQLATESDSSAGTTKTYTYDANGNRASFTLTRNGTTEINQSYTYDKLNRLISVSENGNVIAQYSYDNKGNRTQTVTSGGETTNYTYNLANMLVSQTTGEKLTEQYTYYLNGNQKSKTSNGETTTYEYDAMNRLVKENNTEYSFDDFGNRASMTSGADTVTYEYDLNNRLTESNEVSGEISKTTSYSYDNNGNQTIKTVMTTKPYSNEASKDYFISGTTNENIALYSYNCYNQLIEADTNGVVSSYSYAPDGLRHSKTVGENTTTFVYDNSNVVEEITQDGTNKYYRGFEIIKNDDNLYYIYNGQGDVTILTDNAGTTVADYSFDAYGNQSEENDVYNPFGYRGEYTDEETGFIYLRARYYDTETGRFVSEDPIRDGLNWYVYCGGNPIVFVDPWGLWMTGDENLPQWAQDTITVYTDMWNLAKNDSERKAAHQGAQAVRDFVTTYYKSRNAWGAASSKAGVESITGTRANYYDTLVFHHTNRPKYESIAVLQKTEQANGFSDVPYHFVIGGNGIVYEGMPLDNKGEHTSKQNTGKVGIALMGNFEEHSGLWQSIKDRIQGASFSQPTAIQISNAKQMATFLDVAYGFTTIGGHRNFGETECPGSRLTQLLSPIYKNIYFFSSGGN